MNKTAVELLRTNASYIDALKEAIDRWEKSNDTDEKRDLLAAIGEIGVDVHNRNRQLGLWWGGAQMKIAQARKLLTEDIGRMTLEQLQRHRVKLIDAWRESRAEYGMGQAVMDGFYRQTGEDVTEYTPTDLWLTQNLSHRLDETIGRELELLSDHNSKA